MTIEVKNITRAIHQDIVAYVQHLLKTYPNLTQHQLAKYLTEYGSMMNYDLEETA